MFLENPWECSTGPVRVAESPHREETTVHELKSTRVCRVLVRIKNYSDDGLEKQ